MNSVEKMDRLRNDSDELCRLDYYELTGYRCLGPMLLGMAEWLIDNVRKQNSHDIYFLARDGYIVKRAVDILLSQLSVDDIHTHYLYGSRRMFGVPLLVNWNKYQDAINLFGPKPRIKAESFLKVMGLDDRTLPEYAIGHECSNLDLSNDEVFQHLFVDFEDDIIANANDEFVHLKTYFKQEGLFDVSDPIIVDIGWAGNLQTYLQEFGKLTNAPFANVHGYYLGLNNRAARHPSNISFGYWFDYKRGDADKAAPFRGLVELFFSYSEGSAKRTVSVDGQEKPVLKEYEFSGSPDREKESKRLISIRDSAVRFVEKAAAEKLDTNNLPSSYCCSFLEELGYNPTKKDLAAFSGLLFEDSGEYLPLIPSEGNIRDIVKQFSSSQWKAGYLQKYMPLCTNWGKRLLDVRTFLNPFFGKF
ncbi:MAG: hypothetical protein ACOYJL_03325 [Tractidigestivibacter sp.]|uniref:hypothetical protein n=1 Tax=Tractidigestivibacter sp. TaxID=2847320 RepID=UPI003D91E604